MRPRSLPEIEKYWGLETQSCLRQHGRLHSVYLVRTDDGARSILKLATSRQGVKGIDREARIMRALEFRNPVRAPRVLRHTGGAMLQSHLDGTPLDPDIAAVEFGDAARIEALSSVIAQLQDQKGVDAGRPLDQAIINWVDPLGALVFNGVWLRVRRSLFGSPETSGLRELAPTLRVIARVSRCFSHGDLHEFNLHLARDGQSIGILDFQRATFRPPGFDLIFLCSHRRQRLAEWTWQARLLAKSWPALAERAGARGQLEYLRGMFFHVGRRHLLVDLNKATRRSFTHRRMLDVLRRCSDETESREPSLEERQLAGQIVRWNNLRTILDKPRFYAWLREIGIE